MSIRNIIGIADSIDKAVVALGIRGLPGLDGAQSIFGEFVFTATIDGSQSILLPTINLTSVDIFINGVKLLRSSGYTLTPTQLNLDSSFNIKTGDEISVFYIL